MIEEFRTDVTKTRKDGSRGALRIDYGDPRKPEKPIAWLWKFIDGAKTAGELFCGSESGTDQYEIRPWGGGGAGSVVPGSVRTEWDRREPLGSVPRGAQGIGRLPRLLCRPAELIPG